MLTALRNIGYGARNFYFPPVSLHLHAMISSCGFQREVSQSYDWDGLKRGKTEFALFQVTTKGHGMLRYEETIHDIGPGTAMILSFPHSNRYWLPENSNEWEFLYICFYGREVMRVWRELERVAGPVLSIDFSSPVVSVLRDIVVSMLENEIKSPYEASLLAYSFAMKMAQEYMPYIPPADYPAAIRRAVSLCHERKNFRVSVEDMARAAGYSKYHFTRKFSAVVGVSPGQYLNGRQIERAIHLLDSTDLSVKEIAEACGFYDATHFCKVFRRTVGTTPRSVRQSGMYKK